MVFYSCTALTPASSGSEVLVEAEPGLDQIRGQLAAFATASGTPATAQYSDALDGTTGDYFSVSSPAGRKPPPMTPAEIEDDGTAAMDVESGKKPRSINFARDVEDKPEKGLLLFEFDPLDGLCCAPVGPSSW